MKYSKVIVNRGKKASKLVLLMRSDAFVRSIIDMYPTIEVPLSRVMHSLVRTGIAVFAACGATMYRKVLNAEHPIALPASICPFETDWIPDL